MSELRVGIFPCRGNVDRLPSYATPGSAGLDLAADIESPVILQPQTRERFPTGFAFVIPQGHVGLVCSRSGLAWKNGISVLNSPGVIDSDYRDEVYVMLVNHSHEAYTLQPRARIAQIIFQPYTSVQWSVLGSVPTDTQRCGGFGSTGV